MARQADGTIYVNTAIDSDGFKAGGKEVEAAARKMAKSVNNIGESAKIALQKQTDAFVKQNQAYAAQEQKVKDLEKRLEELSEQKVATDEFSSINTEIAKLEKSLDRAIERRNKFVSTGGSMEKVSEDYKKAAAEVARLEKSLDAAYGRARKFEQTGKNTNSKQYASIKYDIQTITQRLKYAKEELADLETSKNQKSSRFKNLEYDVEQLNKKLDQARIKKEQLETTGGAYKAVDTSALEQKIIAEKQKLLQMNNALGTSYESLKYKVRNGARAMSDFGKKTKKTRMTLGRMLATSLLFSLVFRALSSIMSGISEGFQNLAQYSDETNESLSRLKSALTQLKNSFATAFAPLLNYIEPLLTRFINLLSKAANYVGMFFAALTGKDSYVKAIAVQEDYAESLDKTKDSMKGYLSPLDEINKYSPDKADSSGGVLPEDMFEEVEIDSKLKQFTDKIKSYFSGLNFAPLKTSLSELKESFSPLIDLINNGLGWAWENVLLPLGKWCIEEALPVSIDALGKAFNFLSDVLTALQPVFMWLWDNILVPFGQTVGEVALGIITAFGGVMDFLSGVFSGDWELAFAGLTAIGESFRDALFAILDYVQTIFNNFDNFLQGVFAKDFSESFGLLGYVLNIFFDIVEVVWNSIKGTFEGVIQFIKGVFTGNWKSAWEGIQKILNSAWSAIWNKITQYAKAIWTSVVNIWNSLKARTSSIWNSIVTAIKNPINKIIGVINRMIYGMVCGINDMIGALNSLSFTIPDWIPGLGGSSFGLNIGYLTPSYIPYLASGAVIPPNAPFMAMLGDQKNGRNLEMPEALLRKIVREETGGNQSGGKILHNRIQINRRTLLDEMIEEAKLVQMQSGRNPFEFA